ncbi:hypothetical protein ACHQM5_001895 [Ranunculus cassubicifolius]
MNLESKKHVYVELDWDQGTVHPLFIDDDLPVSYVLSELRCKELIPKGYRYRYALLLDGKELDLTEILECIPEGATLRVVAKENTITPPYPWATNRRCMVHTLETLKSKNLKKISGDVKCRKCDAQYVYEFDLDEKFREVAEYIKDNIPQFPKSWLSPKTPACTHCGEINTWKPVIPENRDEINWLFLLLGQMLGFCTLEQLKDFCMLTENSRTGAKDKVLCVVYLTLCKQLDPFGPFDLEFQFMVYR